jgi:hypothetical protein
MDHTRRGILAGLVAAFILASLMGVPTTLSYGTAYAQNTTCVVSKSQFMALRTGMTYRDAMRILGCEGDEVSRSEMAGFRTVIYAWKGSVWSGANMNAMFQNDRLISKSQAGLSD